MKNNLNIGKIIQEKRLYLNLTMDYVAKQAGISRATISSIENGSYSCSVNNLLKILNVLDLNIEINSDTKSNRKRATRINTALNKKINRFIVFCIEQYANSKNISSSTIYKQMNEKGIIKDLYLDYEDLHGMSTMYLNEYLDAMLK